jgi:6,7-dimethyl-8-ribityllumazine synthase
MVGGMPIDQQCAHEASLGIQSAKLMTNKHIIEVFVHENEAWSEKELFEIFDSRIRKHAHNAYNLVSNPSILTNSAGQGIRQGKSDEGSLSLGEKKLKIAIIRAMFNEEITSKMEEAAIKKCKSLNLDYSLVRVPGVFDIPLPLKKSLLDKSISGAIVLGAVVKGDTSHDEVITKDCVSRVGSLIMEYNKPVALGIIGHNVSWEGAVDRQLSYAENAVSSLFSLIKTLTS